MIYLSIDVETTGLSPLNDQVVEFAAIADDTSFCNGDMPNGPAGPSEPTIYQLPTFRAVIVHDHFSVVPFTASMHKKLWDEMKQVDMDRLKEDGSYVGLWWAETGKIDESLDVTGEATASGDGVLTHYTTPDGFMTAFLGWLDSIRPGQPGYGPSFDFTTNSAGAVRIIAAGKNFGGFDRPFIERLPGAEAIAFKHRCLDPGSMFVHPDDAEPPDLDTCAKRAGYTIVPEKRHTALYDALVVVGCVRSAMVRATQTINR